MLSEIQKNKFTTKAKEIVQELLKKIKYCKVR